ncbi:LytTR family DNA-binding domain-containing protein [Flavobacterium sp. DG1-102-2]|uniref:LytR/AlgR family response regulator transcription factor n=1 Tax=Flavobacterium sp. DG1-102-2 TaxID=3081663 RepID=UPI002949EBEB|nr:LytTR family DNA-binding domain-containing protein [Flavobacterium sp. DG1-102-2]MDV6169459.1 LytTR family DNA-binding domain-containing protein [Flavobacterium sp. DG1-102-2]
MNCIIVDDEPLAREGMLLQLQDVAGITITGSFNGVKKAREFMQDNKVDLIFLDIQMPGVTGLEFASTIPKETLVIFTTAYSQYALQSYEVEAIDYIVKPVNKERLYKAVQKAIGYHELLSGQNASMESMDAEFMLIKSERRYHKILFKDILYIEGLKDYAVIYIEDNKVITAMNLKTIHSHLNPALFARVSKSYLVNINHIDSFDNHTIYIKNSEIPIGDVFRKDFLELYLGKNLSDKL